jgi:glycopeptide antibiotics resistance protein
MTVPYAYPLFAALLVALTILGFVRAIRGLAAPSRIVNGALVLWFLALLYMTIRPGSGGVRLNLVPIMVDGPGSARDAMLNIAVFLPLGMLLATIGRHVLPVLGIAFTVSLTVEVTQYSTNVGRTADVNDLITNVIGAVLGWAFVWLVFRVRRLARTPHSGVGGESREP